MKQYEITNFITNYNDLGNFFNIYMLENGKYFCNILKTINFQNNENIAPGFFTEYVVKEHDTWTTISYNSYGDINLWWLICKFNGIINPIDLPLPGVILKIPTVQLAKTIINDMRNNI